MKSIYEKLTSHNGNKLDNITNQKTSDERSSKERSNNIEPGKSDINQYKDKDNNRSKIARKSTKLK